MTKARMHPALLEFSGAMGDMVFKTRNGKVFVSIKPDMSGVQPTPAQTAHREHERFSQAVDYGKTVMADSDIREIYEQVAKEKGTPLFALTVADFLNPPSIKDADISAYNGQVGDVIKIKAFDDFGVAGVRITITDAQTGDPIESGDAFEIAPGSGLWQYNVTATAPSGTTVNVNVVAIDRPGGTAVNTFTKSI